jgi:ketosteroid isomerase-like protein
VGDKFDKIVETGKLAEQHRYDELGQFYSADVRGWSPSYDFEGIESWLALIAEQNDPFSDIETLNHLVAETDDAVVSEWTWAATHTETGKRLSMKGLSVFEFSDGKVASFRQYFDMAAVMAQFA